VELREELLRRVAAGETPEELARRYDPSAQTIRNWMKDEQKESTVSHESGRSVSDLERENAELRARLTDAEESVDILTQAAAWFATDEKTQRRRRSRS
jgi:transposase